MPSFSRSSTEKLEGVHHYLQDICYRAVLIHDCTIIYGRRTLAEQQSLVAQGLSKTMASKHLIQPDGSAHAVDASPYPINWDNTKRFYYFGGIMLAVSKDILPDGVSLRWGGDWDSDNDLDDQTFMDLVHFELRFH